MLKCADFVTGEVLMKDFIKPCVVDASFFPSVNQSAGAVLSGSGFENQTQDADSVSCMYITDKKVSSSRASTANQVQTVLRPKICLLPLLSCRTFQIKLCKYDRK